MKKTLREIFRIGILALLLLAGSWSGLAAVPLKIVAFGDSTTAFRSSIRQVYSQRLPALLKAKGLAAEVINAGVGGSHTGSVKTSGRFGAKHATDRFEKEVRRQKPQIVVIQFGINDSWVDTGVDGGPSRIPLPDYERNLKLFVGALQADGARVILMTPNRLGTRYHGWRDNTLGAYANVVRRLAQEENTALVDVWSAFSKRGAKIDELMPDGMHPNDAGQELIAGLLVPEIVRLAKLRPAKAPTVKAVRHRRTIVEAGKPVDAFTDWKQVDGFVTGEGTKSVFTGGHTLGRGDFHIIARLRILNQKKSAASFFLEGSHFGFEGAAETVFVNGDVFGGLKLLQPSPEVFERESWFDFEVIRRQGDLRFLINGRMVISEGDGDREYSKFGFRPSRSKMQIERFTVVGNANPAPKPVVPKEVKFATPLIDLDKETGRQVIVDREKGQYLGHPTTCLLEDGKTILCVYPKGHGRGPIVYKRSNDGGLTWSERLPTPVNWATSMEVPTLHRVVDGAGKKRIIMWSGLYPARLAVTEDDGANWSELKKAGEWGGIVVMGCLEKLNTGAGHYLAMFHDDGRFFTAGGRRENPVRFKLFQTISRDGGLTWSFPEVVYESTEIHLCEPGIVRSPDGKQLAVLLRENRRVKNSHVIFSNDEAKNWSAPRELPNELTGDRHTGKYLPDRRLFLTFRDRTPKTWISPTAGDWAGWIGTYEDLVKGKPGQYRLRLKDNHKGADCTYPGVEVLPDGTVVTTTYGHWDQGEQPYILSVRFTGAELDGKVTK
jgi:lysophospholipase L1-like esterase